MWRVIDGDTFVALPDVGFDGGAFPRIRIADFDAPEMGEVNGMTARDRLWFALERNTPEPWPLRIESLIRQRVVEGTKSFDRYVARVWWVDDVGEMVDIREMLV
jgi:endonuclease YncB( thermonuclease family)